MVTVLVRGFVVRVTLTLAAVFLTVAFLGAATAFDATGLATKAVVEDFLAIPVEAVVFLALVLPFVEIAALAALDLVLVAVFLAVGMAIKVEIKSVIITEGEP